MRFTQVIPFIPLASALVLHDPELFENIKIETSRKSIAGSAQSVLDDALGKVDGIFSQVKEHAKDAYHKIHETGCDVESWLEGSLSGELKDFGGEDAEHPDHPHHGPPEHHHPPHDRPPHHRKPDHPPHHEKPNQTIYELISQSKYTTKLAELVNEYPDLVEALNGTAANYTVFAPTDEAFEKAAKYGHKPSKEHLKNILLYHVSGDFYPAGRVLHSYTIPTLYTPTEFLGHAQRLTVRVTLRGPAINFYSRIVAVNIFATNGVIHGVDSVLVPPPNVASIIDLLPGEFSTLELGLTKTGLFDLMNSTEYPHPGGTFFAPSNVAFQKLGPRVNAFLFSKYGQKYLRALLEYHIVVGRTLYSDAFFDGSKDESEIIAARPPYYHYNLPTLLEDKSLSADVARYGPFVSIRINGFSSVTVHDGVASDGVIQVVSDVLIPPKSGGDGEEVFWKGEEMSIEEFKERFEPYVEDNMEL